MGWLRPVHDISLAWRDGLIATKRALRRSGRDGDCPAPRKISAAAEAIVPPDRRSPISEISRRVALRWAWPGTAIRMDRLPPRATICKSRGIRKSCPGHHTMSVSTFRSLGRQLCNSTAAQIGLRPAHKPRYLFGKHSLPKLDHLSGMFILYNNFNDI